MFQFEILSLTEKESLFLFVIPTLLPSIETCVGLKAKISHGCIDTVTSSYQYIYSQECQTCEEYIYANLKPGTAGRKTSKLPRLSF